MTAISKNVYFDLLDDIVNKYNNTIHRTITLFIVINKIKNRVPWTNAISDLNGEAITGSFYEKEL